MISRPNWNPTGLQSTLLVCLVATLILSFASPAQAYRRYYGGGGSSYANGMSNAIRAQGQAAIAYQQAYALYIQNRQAATTAYFEMRKTNKEYTTAEHGEPLSSEQFSRYGNLSEPKRSSASQLDPVTGHIAWTPILLGEDYAASRKTLDTLFVHRAHHESLATESLPAEIRDAGHQMVDEFKKHLNELPNQEFEESLKLLEGLIFEAPFPRELNKPPTTLHAAGHRSQELSP